MYLPDLLLIYQYTVSLFEISLRAILSWYCNWYFSIIRNAKVYANFYLHNNKSIMILKNHISAYYTFQIAIIFFIVKFLVQSFEESFTFLSDFSFSNSSHIFPWFKLMLSGEK